MELEKVRVSFPAPNEPTSLNSSIDVFKELMRKSQSFRQNHTKPNPICYSPIIGKRETVLVSNKSDKKWKYNGTVSIDISGEKEYVKNILNEISSGTFFGQKISYNTIDCNAFLKKEDFYFKCYNVLVKDWDTKKCLSINEGSSTRFHQQLTEHLGKRLKRFGFNDDFQLEIVYNNIFNQNYKVNWKENKFFFVNNFSVKIHGGDEIKNAILHLGLGDMQGCGFGYIALPNIK